MKNSIVKLNEFLQEEPIIVYKKIYTKIFGSTNAGLLASNLIYWSKTKNHGEFYKTNLDLCDEIGLSLDELKAAKKKVLYTKVFSIKVKGVPPKSFYKIDLELLLSLIEKNRTPVKKRRGPIGGNTTNQLVKIPPINGGNTTNQLGGIPPNTTSTTTTITSAITSTKKINKKISVPDDPEPTEIEFEVESDMQSDSRGVNSEYDSENQLTSPHPINVQKSISCDGRSISSRQEKFDVFWEHYPNKSGKKKAFERFLVALKEVSIERMVEAIEAKKIEITECAKLGVFCSEFPMPAKWLRHGYWDNEVKTLEQIEIQSHIKAREKMSYRDMQSVAASVKRDKTILPPGKMLPPPRKLQELEGTCDE